MCQFYYFADLNNWYLKQLLSHLLVQAVNDIIALTIIRKLQKMVRDWYCLACRLQGKLGIDCVFIILLGSYIFLISHSCTERPMWQSAILDSTWQCVCVCVCTYICKVYETGFMDNSKWKLSYVVFSRISSKMIVWQWSLEKTLSGWLACYGNCLTQSPYSTGGWSFKRMTDYLCRFESVLKR